MIEEIKKLNVEQIASFCSSETGYGVPDIMRVFNSQFLFTENHIKKGNLEDVKLDYLGKFKKKIFKRKRNGVN